MKAGSDLSRSDWATVSEEHVRGQLCSPVMFGRDFVGCRWAGRPDPFSFAGVRRIGRTELPVQRQLLLVEPMMIIGADKRHVFDVRLAATRGIPRHKMMRLTT